MDFASEARIEISTLCNHRCIFCSHDELKRKKELMSFDLFKHIISEVQKQPSIEQISFTGFGEMFLDKRAIEKVKYVSDLGYKVNILTNGTLLNKEIVDSIFELGVNNFRISVHSLDEDEFSRLTGTNKKLHKKLMDIISYISSKRNGITRFLVTAVIDGNEDEVKEIIDKLQPMVDYLDIWKPHNWSNAFHYRDGVFTKPTCKRPFRGPLQIQVDGTVNMCCFDYDGKLTLGDLKTQSIEEIFQSEEYKKILHHHTIGDYTNSNLICETCDQRMEYDGLIYSTVKDDRTNMFSSSYQKMK